MSAIPAAWRPRSILDRASERAARVWRDHATLVLLLAVALLTLSDTWSYHDLILTPEGGIVLALCVLPLFLVMGVVGLTTRTPRHHLVVTLGVFLVAVALSIVAAVLNTDLGWLPRSVSLLAVTGPVEETVKLLAVYLVAYRARAILRPIDGLYFGIAAGVGFAVIENVGYAFRAAAADGWASAVEVALARSFSPDVGINAHLLFSSITGLALGIAMFRPAPKRGGIVLTGLASAALVHGAWDILAFGLDDGSIPAGFAALLPILDGALVVFSALAVVSYHVAERRARSVAA